MDHEENDDDDGVKQRVFKIKAILFLVPYLTWLEGEPKKERERKRRKEWW